MGDEAGSKNEDSKRDPHELEDKDVHGLPYDWRRPTVSRAKSRMWNGEDPRMFPPKSFGAGWTVNFYWLAHLPKYLLKDKKNS